MRQEAPPITPLAQRTNTVFTKIIDYKRQLATDFTGKLPVTSNKGNKYLFVLYEYSKNSVFLSAP